MIRTIEVDPERTPDDYAADAVLRQAVWDMEDATETDVESLADRTIWMVNSTASGGGVAEMMEMLVGTIRALDVDAEWCVMEADDPGFFEVTKHVHNLLHGSGDLPITDEERDRYERVSRDVADAMLERIGSDDVLCVHDPQPLAAGALVAEETGVPAVWRCHIGSGERSRESEAAWTFLRPWIDHYDRTVFSLQEYVPEFLQGEANVVPPAIDPHGAKNRRLKPRRVADLLARSALLETVHPVDRFDQVARRLQPDGSFAPATEPEDVGLLLRPTVCQVSRWDRLKGFVPLLEGFVRLKEAVRREGTPLSTDAQRTGTRSEDHRRRVERARLVLAGPDPSSVSDDPEGEAVLEEIETAWRSLDQDLRDDIAVVVMPADQHTSALVINALQRATTIVAQNSLREGFGLTVTEAMWKRAVLVGSDTGGIHAQVRDGKDGLLIPDASDPESVAATLDEAMASEEQWDDWSNSAQRRVTDNYLVFGQVTRWLDTIGETVR
jgi:trehalose synthase